MNMQKKTKYVAVIVFCVLIVPTFDYANNVHKIVLSSSLSNTEKKGTQATANGSMVQPADSGRAHVSRVVLPSIGTMSLPTTPGALSARDGFTTNKTLLLLKGLLTMPPPLLGENASLMMGQASLATGGNRFASRPTINGLADATSLPTGAATDVENKAALTQKEQDEAYQKLFPAENNEQKYVSDLYEKTNRQVFEFNESTDAYILKPVSQFYNKLVPKPLNKGIHNFFSNLYTVPTIANDVLQLHFTQTLNDLWRLGINSTLGFIGLFDVAKQMKLGPYTNDFGLTLARWGWEQSAYLVLPFWGPNTLRDSIDLPVDFFVLSVFPYIHPPSVRYGLYALGVVDRRAQLLKVQDLIEEASLDKYVFVRSAYMQRRAYQIEQNRKLGYFRRHETRSC